MMSCGIDSTDIARFTHFYTKSNTSLQRIYTPNEIAYCKENYYMSAERFAVRFAAKEALYKALCQLHQQHISLLRVFRCTEVTKAPFPQFYIKWSEINLPPCQVHVSLTHTTTTATAMVVIMKT